MYHQFKLLQQISYWTGSSQLDPVASTLSCSKQVELRQYRKHHIFYLCENWSSTWAFRSPFSHRPSPWLDKLPLCWERILRQIKMLSAYLFFPLLFLQKLVVWIFQWQLLRLHPLLSHFLQRYIWSHRCQNRIVPLFTIQWPVYRLLEHQFYW